MLDIKFLINNFGTFVVSIRLYLPQKSWYRTVQFHSLSNRFSNIGQNSELFIII